VLQLLLLYSDVRYPISLIWTNRSTLKLQTVLPTIRSSSLRRLPWSPRPAAHSSTSTVVLGYTDWHLKPNNNQPPDGCSPSVPSPAARWPLPVSEWHSLLDGPNCPHCTRITSGPTMSSVKLVFTAFCCKTRYRPSRERAWGGPCTAGYECSGQFIQFNGHSSVDHGQDYQTCPAGRTNSASPGEGGWGKRGHLHVHLSSRTWAGPHVSSLNACTPGLESEESEWG